METNPSQQSDTAASTQAPAGFKAKLVLLLLCLAVIAVGAVSALTLIRSAPTVKKRPPVKMTPLVRVQAVTPDQQTIRVEAMGTVVPARELILKSRVAGQIIDVHPEFIQGGIIRNGEEVLRIDDLDYTLLLAQKQSAVADKQFALKLELGRQDIAQREWELLNGSTPASEADTELALRKPHLEKARSDLAAAQAEYASAQLQLERTRISAPFNAVIRQTHVENGSQIAAQENLATLVGTDEFWVRVSVPIDRLRWIEIPGNRQSQGAPAQVYYHGDAMRQGRVMKLLSDLESEGRMARLLVAVQDPLGLDRAGGGLPAMLIGEYVRVVLQGQQIDSAYRIPRSALHDNRHVWLVDTQGKLLKRQVETVWRDSRSVVIRQGLNPGDRIVVSDLSTPISGMAVQIEGDSDRSIKPASVDGVPIKTTTGPKG